MEHLSFEVGYNEGIVMFSVHHQSDGFTDWVISKRREGGFKASNGWAVLSQVCPEVSLKTKRIFLRGSEAINNDLVVGCAAGDNPAYRVAEDIADALREAHKAYCDSLTAAKTPRPHSPQRIWSGKVY